MAYWATESAGKIGTLCIIFLTGLVSAYVMPTAWEKVKEFLKIVLMLAILLSVFAYLNEHLIKPALAISRPSHSYILKQSNSTAKIDSLYNLAEENRRQFFQGLIATDTLHFKTVDQRVLDHWVAEAGYSFPSGHSFNAFLLAGILAFKLGRSKERKIRLLAGIPLLWAGLVALSRVAIGAHSALDVSVGAGLGMILSHTLIAIPATRRLVQSSPQAKMPQRE